MERSQELAPVDTGAMRASGFVNLPRVEGNEITVTMGYGGASKDYVVIQHEDLTLNHEVGEAKFLEKPVLEAAPTLLRDIAADVDLGGMVR